VLSAACPSRLDVSRQLNFYTKDNGDRRYDELAYARRRGSSGVRNSNYRQRVVAACCWQRVEVGCASTDHADTRLRIAVSASAKERGAQHISRQHRHYDKNDLRHYGDADTMDRRSPSQ